MIIKKIFDLTPAKNLYETLYVLATTWLLKDQAVMPRNIINPVIIDIGAHIGITARFFKHYHPTSKIICYEPNPDTFKILKQNTHKLDNVRLINSAIHDFNGQTNLNLSNRSWDDSLFANGGLDNITVKVASASDVCRPHVDLLKIDAEGSEYAIINDLNQSGKLANIDRIIMEFHGRINDKQKLKQMLDIFKKNSFKYSIGVYFRILKVDEKRVLKSKSSIYDFLIINAWKNNQIN